MPGSSLHAAGCDLDPACLCSVALGSGRQYVDGASGQGDRGSQGGRHEAQTLWRRPCCRRDHRCQHPL